MLLSLYAYNDVSSSRILLLVCRKACGDMYVEVLNRLLIVYSNL